MEIYCQICDCEPEGYTTYYAHNLFLDNRNYEYICYRCACSIKRTESTTTLYTPDEMAEFGWSTQEARISLDAIKAVISDSAVVVESELGFNVFNKLIKPLAL